MTERLTSLAAVKDWLGIDNENSDKSLARIVNAASQFVLGQVGRDSFAPATYRQTFRGTGKLGVLLKQWPVISISSLTGLSGATFTAANIGPGGISGAGFTISDPRDGPQMLELWGTGFISRAPYEVVYQAGFEAVEKFIIGEDLRVDTFAGGQWASNVQVVDRRTNTDMTAVEVEPTLSGQYRVDLDGNYTFATADKDVPIAIRYGYVPWDASFAVTQLIGEWFTRKDRIGLLSKTLGGQETVSFSQGDMSSAVRSSLNRYMNVAPI